MVNCHCGKVAVVKTSWTNINPGRRFYSCPDVASDCPFVDWVDPPMCPRSVNIIPGLLRSLNNHRGQIQVLQEERARMKKQLYVSWAFVFMFVAYIVLT
ncbi:zinc finger, GRF-type [Artemisia annua]|uniref:Zinc finger, GRF-type n=1 Tax=Artemisia annua TaxID=35608 RepID=A0A2U1NK66_ARTAN|nr:zinc finger, GRF-type [Artemisia annua]PWA73895.1 zinc finger, GRF-type [Artemisia annua]PWA87424.1 zinc finger, GRF-type [Artemisia annua]